MKLLAVHNVGLGAAPEDGAGYAGLKGEAGDVVCKKPGSGVGHPGVFDQV